MRLDRIVPPLAVAVLLTLVGPDTAGGSASGLASPATGGSVGSVGSVGSRSGGDPYFPADGNGGYQVEHYRISDAYDPATDVLRGRTVIRATAREDLSRFNLDLVLRPDRVEVDGQPAAFAKAGRHELTVTPPRLLPAGVPFTVRVDYSGRPASAAAVGVRPGQDVFVHRPGETLAIGEPQSGPWWFAANETPTDKATYDILLRVPRGQQAVSNGELVARGTTAAGRTVWHWRTTEPMTTYLAFFAAGEFRLERGTADGRPYVYAVSRRMRPAVQDRSLHILRRTAGVISWLEHQFGDYPFTSIGGVAAGIPLGYALENQTRPVYPGRWLHLGLLVHELAHQWFGDSVSVSRWRDVWLNEGFATYAEWLYTARHGGPSLRRQLESAYDRWPADSGFWTVPLSDPGRDDLFSGPVYLRGAMTLAALHRRIGGAAFEELLRRWVAEHRHGNVVGQQFRSLAGVVSLSDLDGFFADWLDHPVKPEATPANGLG